MTEIRKPPPCHYDRGLGERVTRDHRDDCPDPIGHAGCVPCTAPHCVVCGREHLDNTHPDTCPECEGRVADDLTDIQASHTALFIEAMEAGADGRLVAAAPIPGGNAAVLIGPTVRLNMMRTYRGWTPEHFLKDHPVSAKTGQPIDPVPPLALLAQWEDIYRTWLGQQTSGEPTKSARWGDLVSGPRRATIAGAIAYLKGQLPNIANHLTDEAPDWVEFTRQIRRLRADCERALHDEQEPERGVECFECGDRLVRRFRSAKRCRHSTKARRQLEAWMADRAEILEQIRMRREEARRWVQVVESYPELGAPYADELEACTAVPRMEELRAAAAPPASLIAAARRPCRRCARSQGGIDNPDPGRSWECPGCRREYTPGEYHTAVRRDLLENADAWTTIVNARAAIKGLTGQQLGDKTLRSWVNRDWVASKFETKANGQTGSRLVFWPDVKREAMRLSAGKYHCRHRTAARDWVKVLQTYPEIPVWEDELDACRIECRACATAVEQTFIPIPKTVDGGRVSA